MQNTTKVKIATFTFDNPAFGEQMLVNMQLFVEAELGVRNRDASWSGSHAYKFLTILSYDHNSGQRSGSLLLGVEPGEEVRGEIHNDFDSTTCEWTITGWAWL